MDTLFDLNINYVDNFEVIDEASHGKLKFDYRAAFDFNTGHALKIVYSLDNIDIKDIPILRNDPNAGDKIKDVEKNIAYKGNGDHKSEGQKVLAIIDRATGEKLQEADTIGPYQDGISSGAIELDDDILKYIQAKYKDKIQHIKVGEIDSNATFKSTKWFSNDTIDKKIRGGIIMKSDNSVERRNAMEGLLNGRGAKMDDIKGDYVIHQPVAYNHPSKKDIKQNPELYKKESIDDILNTDINDDSMDLFNIDSFIESKEYNEMCNLIEEAHQMFPRDLYLSEEITSPGVGLQKGIRQTIHNTYHTTKDAVEVGRDVSDVEAGLFKSIYNLIMRCAKLLGKFVGWILNLADKIPTALIKLIDKITSIPGNIKMKIRGDIKLYVTIHDIQSLYDSANGYTLMGNIIEFIEKGKQLISLPDLTKAKVEKKLEARILKLSALIRSVEFKQTLIDLSREDNKDIYVNNKPVLNILGKSMSYKDAIVYFCDDVKKHKDAMNEIKTKYAEMLADPKFRDDIGNLPLSQRSMLSEIATTNIQVFTFLTDMLKYIMSDIKMIDNAFKRHSKETGNMTDEERDVYNYLKNNDIEKIINDKLLYVKKDKKTNEIKLFMKNHESVAALSQETQVKINALVEHYYIDKNSKPANAQFKPVKQSPEGEAKLKKLLDYLHKKGFKDVKDIVVDENRKLRFIKNDGNIMTDDEVASLKPAADEYIKKYGKKK